LFLFFAKKYAKRRKRRRRRRRKDKPPVTASTLRVEITGLMTPAKCVNYKRAFLKRE